MELDRETAIFFRNQFREARAVAYRDAEGFQEILFTLERFGAYLNKKIQDLGKYESKITSIACQSPLAEDVPNFCKSWHLSFSDLYDLIREARNDALHQGAFVRHLTNNATRLALVLEDALMIKLNKAADYMVREPVCASLWQPISFIRQQLLVNSFTYLPVSVPQGKTRWQLVSDYAIADYLRKGDKRKERLATTLEKALEEADLELEPAGICHPDASINEILELSSGKPVLVVEAGQPDRLLGIVTPFDLL